AASERARPPVADAPGSPFPDAPGSPFPSCGAGKNNHGRVPPGPALIRCGDGSRRPPMHDGFLHGLLGRLREAVRPGRPGAPADAELLRRWVRGRDEAAFELLVWRHGRLVLSVCRRLLRDARDVEDAFQATFLVLVRKAPAIARRQAVAAW